MGNSRPLVKEKSNLESLQIVYRFKGGHCHVKRKPYPWEH